MEGPKPTKASSAGWVLALPLAAAETLANGRLPRGNRLAILSNGGGPGALAADAVEDSHVALAKLSEGARAALDLDRASE